MSLAAGVLIALVATLVLLVLALSVLAGLIVPLPWEAELLLGGLLTLLYLAGWSLAYCSAESLSLSNGLTKPPVSVSALTGRPDVRG